MPIANSNTSVVTTEVEEVSSLPPAKLFKAFHNFDKIAPKMDPKIYKSINVVQGDGGVGSIINYTYADGLPYTNLKIKVDEIDTKNHILTYTFFEGDALMGIIDTTTQQLKFIPSKEGGSIFKHTSTFNIKAGAKLTEETLNLIKESQKKTIKDVEAYLIANPDA